MEAIILLVVSLLLISKLIKSREGFESYPYTQGTLMNEAYHGKTGLLKLNEKSPFWRFYEGYNDFALKSGHITYPKNYTYRIRHQNHKKVSLGGCQHHTYNVPY